MNIIESHKTWKKELGREFKSRWLGHVTALIITDWDL